MRRRSPSPTFTDKKDEKPATLTISSLTHKTPLRSRNSVSNTPITANFLSPLFKTPGGAQAASPLHQSQSDTSKKRRAQVIDACESFSAKREPLANESPMSGGARSALFIPPRTPEISVNALLGESPSAGAHKAVDGRGIKIERSGSFTSVLDEAEDNDAGNDSEDDGNRSKGVADVAPMEISAETHASTDDDSLPPTPSKSCSPHHNNAHSREETFVKTEPKSPTAAPITPASAGTSATGAPSATPPTPAASLPPAPAPAPHTTSSSPRDIKREASRTPPTLSGALSAALAAGNRHMHGNRSESPLSRASSSASSIALPPLKAPPSVAAASMAIPSSYSAPASYFQHAYMVSL